MKSIAKRTNPLCFAHNVVNSQIASLFGRCNILGHPVVIAGINIGIGNIFAADQIRFRIPQYDSAGIIHHDFLHLYDDISPFCRIKFTGQFSLRASYSGLLYPEAFSGVFPSLLVRKYTFIKNSGSPACSVRILEISKSYSPFLPISKRIL